MKAQMHNLREFTPVVLLSVLLFVSCARLPVIEEEPSANSQPSAGEQPSADREPSAGREPSANGEPSANRQPSAEINSSAGEIASTAENQSQEAAESAAGTAQVMENTGLPQDPTPGSADTELPDEQVPQLTREELEQQARAEELASQSELTLDPGPQQLAQEALYHQQVINGLCDEIGNKLGSVSVEDCMQQQLEFAGAYSVNARPLTQRDFEPRNSLNEKSRVLIMGGIHGDEYSSISIMFKWMALLEESGGNSFSWRFLPSVNPDGLLDGQAVRQNASGVDLNRNFPSQDWNDKAHEYWLNNTGENPRRYPGVAAASEPEVRWVIDQIETYEPDVVVSVHAPYHLLDFDGPSVAPDRIGDLYLHQLGVYPGSLGNYAGLDLGIPVVTLELPSAGIMPSDEQIEQMWIDMLSWLNSRTELEQRAAR